MQLSSIDDDKNLNSDLRTSAVLKIDNISKSFPGVQALKNVSFEILSGQILGILGENGAGKSTLMNIIGGVIRQDEGEMYLSGKPYNPKEPINAKLSGIAFIHQELSNFEALNVTDNIYVGLFPFKKGFFIDYKKSERFAIEILKKLGVEINPKIKMRDLSIGERQLVEIAKAISCESKIVIFDEPTTSLTDSEKIKLYEVIMNLKQHGTAVIFISHLLDEIFEICDRIIVLRDGQKVSDKLVSQTNKVEAVKMMIGREIDDFFPNIGRVTGKIVLNIEDLTTSDGIKDINLSIREGEIVGLWGLLGSGRSEIVRAVFGQSRFLKGYIEIGGKKFYKLKISDAIKSGVGFLTENRRENGLIDLLSVKENLTLPSLKRITRKISKLIDFKSENKIAKDMVDRLNIKTPNLTQKVKNLSGGNQQKIVFGKWLALSPKIFLLDEPTKGIDVGSKAEIHKLIADLAKNNAAILIISSDIEEILSTCHKIIVLHKGKIKGELKQNEANKEKLMNLAMGQEVRL